MCNFFFYILKSILLVFQLFSAKVMGDPFLWGRWACLHSGLQQHQGQDSHVLLLEKFSKLLELVTLHDQLIETSLESHALSLVVGYWRSRWGITYSGSPWLQALSPLGPCNQSELSVWLKWPPGSCAPPLSQASHVPLWPLSWTIDHSTWPSPCSSTLPCNQVLEREG